MKYLNDAIIGNRNMTVSFSKNGELLRLFNEAPDYKQFFEFFHTGVKINDSAMVYLHNDINNSFKQYYVENTNILMTEVFNSYFNLKVVQTDFCLVKDDLLVRKFKFINKSNIDLNINFLVYSKLLTNINNDTCGLFKNDCLYQYNHDYTACIFAKEKIDSCQINNAASTIMDGVIGDKDYVGMSSDSSIEYNVGVLKPGEEKVFELFVYINNNKEKSLLSELDNEIERFRKIDYKKELDDCKKYWRRYLKNHDKIQIKDRDVNEVVEQIYYRSILLFPLLINENTGGISAGVEVDEEKTKCGRYSYCWARDAAFITEAFDEIGMEKETEKFYKSFCKMTQSKNGMWEQRFYTDGMLAPSWGYQIDETASVVYGVYKHFEKFGDKKFLKDCLKMCENAIDFIEKYVKDILEEKFLMQKSYDLWEEYEGISLYSISSIYGAYAAMLKIYSEVKEFFVNNRLKLEAISKMEKVLDNRLRELKSYVLKTFYNENKKSFVRNIDDNRIDISILGAVTPFSVLSPKEKKVVNTIERMNMTIRTYTGGYIRYEGDTYMNGYNPWPIANLWMANYYLDSGERKKARECFEFVAKSCSVHGFLGEQVNNETFTPAWVIGLTWSHAMFIIVLKRLADLGLV
ncbi:MAG: hypothetical protein IKG42_00660 [Clostridia bacterium]|nr:hypothetical protein [Clostridia bacterium]